MRTLISTQTHYVVSQNIKAKLIFEIYQEDNNGEVTVDIQNTGVSMCQFDGSKIYDIQDAEQIIQQFVDAEPHRRMIKQGPVLTNNGYPDKYVYQNSQSHHKYTTE